MSYRDIGLPEEVVRQFRVEVKEEEASDGGLNLRIAYGIQPPVVFLIGM
jgi:hypothetical protein